MDIIGFENYLIYSDGRVFNKKRNIFVKPNICNGYYRLKLNDKNKYVHRLIAIHYIPNPDNKKYVDHIDRNRLNNDISNLRWATSCENNQNTSMSKNNTSGHKNISYDKRRKSWDFGLEKNGKRHRKNFKSLTDALCYKFIMTLKFKSQVPYTTFTLK